MSVRSSTCLTNGNHTAKTVIIHQLLKVIPGKIAAEIWEFAGAADDYVGQTKTGIIPPGPVAPAWGVFDGNAACASARQAQGLRVICVISG